MKRVRLLRICQQADGLTADRESAGSRSETKGGYGLFGTCLVLVFLLTGWLQTHAQSYHSQASADAYNIAKTVSDTIISSNQIFVYSITFTLPPNATNVVISDQIPGHLDFLASQFVVTEACPPGAGVSASEVAPPVNSAGGNYELRIPNSGPCGVVGSINIQVKFRCGVTCNNTQVRNLACIRYSVGGTDRTLCTGPVTTVARATNPWNIQKTVINRAYQGGACPNAVNDSVITYRIDVFKTGGITGQLNLYNALVTDVLPPGAYLAGSSSCMTATGSTQQTLTWNPGDLTACTWHNGVSCTFSVVYPRALFPLGSQVMNTARLTGNLGDSITKCGSFVDSSTVCSEFRVVTSGALSKKVVTNGQPGCAGTYTLVVCNNGNDSLFNISVVDSLPALDYGTPTIQMNPGGWTAPITNGILTVTSGSVGLAPGRCVTITVPFTIPVGTPPGVIQNCAVYTARGDTTRRVCAPFLVVDPQPQLCLRKSVCNPQPIYAPGDVVTYRLRLLNIGGEDLVGATITDVLDNNLKFVPGTVRAYQSGVLGPSGEQCGQTTDSWGSGVVTIPPPVGSNTLQFTLPTIPFNCDAAGSCGQNWNTVPYYIVEFDAIVIDSAVLGGTPNVFSVSDDQLAATVTSDPAWILISALTSYWVEKEVRPAGSLSWSSSATVTPGSAVDFRLRLGVATTPPGLAALRQISFVDLLPRNGGANMDGFIGNCNPRGSQFDLSVLSFTSPSNPAAVGFREVGAVYPRIWTWGVSPSTLLSPPLYRPLFGTPPNVPGCSTNNPSAWVSGQNVGDMNVGYYFGPWAFTPASTPVATVELRAEVAADAGIGDSACNTFYAGAAVRRRINGRIEDVPIAGMESRPVCLITENLCSEVSETDVTCRVGPDGQVVYDVCVTIQNTSDDPIFHSTGWITGESGITVVPGPIILNLSPPNSVPPGGSFTQCYTVSGSGAVPGAVLQIRDTLHLWDSVQACVMCVVSDSLVLPECPLPTECCPVDFSHDFNRLKFTLDHSGNGTVSGMIGAGPLSMQSISFSLIGAWVRGVPATGQLTSGIVDGSGGTVSPMHDIMFGQWAPCRDLRTSAPFTLGVKLPPYSCPPVTDGSVQSWQCPERDSICLRVRFVDCDCRSCDTVICLAVTRKRSLPMLNFGMLSGTRLGGTELEKGSGPAASNSSAYIAGLLLDDSSGRFDIRFPEPLDESISVRFTGLAIEPLDGSGYIIDAGNGTTDLFFAAAGNAYGVFDAGPGDSMSVALNYNDFGDAQFIEHRVTLKYTVDGEPQEEEIPVTFYRTGTAGGDVVRRDDGSNVEALRTFGLHLQNLNRAERPIARLLLTFPSGVELVAAGPTSSTERILLDFGEKAGVRFVGEEIGGHQILLDPTDVIAPIYVTLRGGDGDTEIGYSTVDERGSVITEGVLSLPVSVTEDRQDGTAGGIMMYCYPNPASETASLELYLPTSTEHASLKLVDGSGRVVREFPEMSRFHRGSHVVVVDLVGIPTGNYHVVLSTDYDTETHVIRIVR